MSKHGLNGRAPPRKPVQRHPSLPPLKAASDMTATGTLKFYDRTRGFGFIAPNDGSKDVFVHASTVYAYSVSDHAMEKGLPLRFAVEQSPKGPQATAIAVMT